jgi:hypothetical protein
MPNQPDPRALHPTYLGIAAELIGIAVLAIFAEMSEDIGKIAVTVMVGWFIIFLMLNAADVRGAFTHVGLIPPGQPQSGLLPNEAPGPPRPPDRLQPI